MNRLIFVFILYFGAISAVADLHAVTLPFADNFDDGSATDGSPGNWIQGGDPSATQSVINDSLVIASAGFNSPARLEGTLPPDLSILTQVRFLDSNAGSDAAALEARNGGEGFLIALLSVEGGLTIGSVIPQVGFSVLASGSAPVDPVANETLLQFDAFGPDLALTAWEVGDPKPSPQVTVTSDALLGTNGTIGAGIFVPGGQPATVAFRFVEAVPEPSMAILAVSGVIASCSWRARRVHQEIL